MKHDNLDLIKHHITQAERTLEESIILKKAEHYNGSLNRAYYSIYHSAKALLEFKGIETKTHSGLMAMFNDHFMRTAELPNTLYDDFQKAEILRDKADYADLFEGTIELAEQQLNRASRFLNESIKYLEKNLKIVFEKGNFQDFGPEL